MSLPVGYYINLDNRPDRKQHFENQKLKFPVLQNIERFSAIEHKNGAIGCGKSHIQVLQMCQKFDEESFLICEDDLLIFNSNNFEQFIKTLDDKQDWDLITLTPRGDTLHNDELSNGFKRIINNQTTSAYIVKKCMIPILIKNLQEAIEGLEIDGKSDVFAIDQYWKRLQIKYKFYYFEKLFAGQLPGFSNVEYRNVDYNQRFLLQNNY
jgi:GR25 family glycosyltransferase involved in LPS biosynthesis